LGWHYASDMFGGLVLAMLSIWLATHAQLPWFPAALSESAEAT
jgi:hypothetical protein